TGAKNEGLIFAGGKPLRKVPTERLVDELFVEIDKSREGRAEVDLLKAAEGAEWLAKSEGGNAAEETAERMAALEAAAADDNGHKRISLDEDASPTAGRRFTRT